jgi:hypothetical protein
MKKFLFKNFWKKRDVSELKTDTSLNPKQSVDKVTFTTNVLPRDLVSEKLKEIFFYKIHEKYGDLIRSRIGTLKIGQDSFDNRQIFEINALITLQTGKVISIKDNFEINDLYIKTNDKLIEEILKFFDDIINKIDEKIKE